jgi:hypothetical protein
LKLEQASCREWDTWCTLYCVHFSLSAAIIHITYFVLIVRLVQQDKSVFYHSCSFVNVSDDHAGMSVWLGSRRARWPLSCSSHFFVLTVIYVNFRGGSRKKCSSLVHNFFIWHENFLNHTTHWKKGLKTWCKPIKTFLKINVFWDIMPSSLVDHLTVRGTCFIPWVLPWFFPGGGGS